TPLSCRPRWPSARPSKTSRSGNRRRPGRLTRFNRRDDNLVGDGGDVGIQGSDQQGGDDEPHELEADKGGDRGGGDAGEGVGEGPADGDRRIGEAGRRREEVGGPDVSTDGKWCDRGPTGAHDAEDHNEQ